MFGTTEGAAHDRSFGMMSTYDAGVRYRSAILAWVFAVAGALDAIACVIYVVTQVGNGRALAYLSMVVTGISAFACLVAAVAILDRRRPNSHKGQGGVRSGA